MHLFLLLQEAAPEGGGGSSLLSPNAGLMVWTVLIFVTVWFILSRFAFPKITDAVRAREASLQAAIDEAQRDRDEAQRLLSDQREQIAAARDEAQKIIADARGAGEGVRSKMLEQAHAETADLLERARREIATERDRAIAEMRREAVDLAIAGASRVIGKNLDDLSNRQLVESFLASIPSSAVAPKAGA
ncbi:MAG TPA: F0F1 ATP synthase subunit B [Candidatus Elarobacter sp.]|nr:F0F1 ATP synthase subunit B [Candidatus Elarobacter sp.]